MLDKFGRNIDYIRISVTDRCNLRCVYCMPEEGVESIPHSGILTFDEIVRICTVMAKNGLSKVKITGGEPLVRKNIDGLISQIKAIDGINSVTITTNGVLLAEYYDKLVKAGVDCITVSLDTLDREKYKQLTRRDNLEDVLRGIRLAQEKGGTRLKINVVPMQPVNEAEIVSMIEFAKNYDTDVRFIEVMPIGLGNNYAPVTEDDIKAVIEKNCGKLTLCSEVRGNGPSVHYSLENYKGKIGFISAVSHKFCDKCNRIRLTADGYLKTCLQYDTGVNLMPCLRGDCSDEKLAQELAYAVSLKPQGHHFEQREEFDSKEHRKMSQIGG